jgi:hypothetical protein
MPITANIIHTAKHTVNAKVLALTTEICFVRFVVIGKNSKALRALPLDSRQAGAQSPRAFFATRT